MELEGEHYTSPRWSYEILDCAMPMTFDTYSNCAHQCVYCFAFFQRAVKASAEDYLHHRVHSVDVEKVKRMFLDPDAYAGQFAWYIKRRMVLQWGGLSDGFDWYERKFRKSLELLKFFCQIDYPISISTKGTWWVYDPEYRAVLRNAKNVHIKYSLVTTDKHYAAQLEAGTPEPLERFKALEECKKLGVGCTTVRFRPFIPWVSDLCVEDMFKRTARAGCYSLTTEWLFLENRVSGAAGERYKMIGDVCREAGKLPADFDLLKWYHEQSYSGGGLLRLNYDYKRPYIEQMQALAEQYDLKFFVSDAHHKEASHSAGCCGLPDTGPLSNINRGQYAEAILIAKKNGRVRWSDIALAAQPLKLIPFYRAEGFPNDSDERAKRRYQSMFSYMQDIWNTPKSWASPARYFGGALVPSGIDEDGNVIYLYNRPFIEENRRVGSAAELAGELTIPLATGKARAKKYDEATADGAEFGYVAYPIFIPTHNRVQTATTPKLLDAARLPYTLVCDPDQANAYSEKFPQANIMPVPRKGRGIVYARQWLLEHARSDGMNGYWVLDDDIQNYVQFGVDGSQKPATIRAALSSVEALLSRYTNVVVAAPTLAQFAWAAIRRGETFTYNRCYWIGWWMRADTGIDHDPDLNVKCDVGWLIEHLATGNWVSIMSNEFGVRTPAMASNAGGLHSVYVAGKQNAASRKLAAQWPHYCKLNDKGGTKGTDLAIQWNEFMGVPRITALEAMK